MLHGHIQQLESQLTDATRHISDVTKLNHQLKLEVAHLNGSDPTRYMDTVSRLQHQVSDLEAALATASARTRALESELAVPSANLAYLSRQNELLQQRVSIYKKELDDQADTQQLLAAKEGLEHGQECHHRFDGVCNDLIESLRAEILHGRDLHRTDLIALLDQLGELARENQALRDPDSTLLEPHTPHSPTRSVDDTLERVARTLHADNGELLEQVRSYEATIAATEAQMTQLRSERETQEAEVELLLEKLNPMVAAHEAAMEERKAMEADLAQREAMIQALQANVYEMKREIKIITADVDAIVEEKELLQEELDELRNRQSVVAGAATATEPPCKSCVGLQQQIDELSTEVRHSNPDMIIFALQESLETAEAEVRPLRRSLSMKDQTIQETKTRVTELERRLVNDKSEYEKAVAERDHAIEALQKKVFEYKREVNVLTDDYDSIFEEKHEVEQKLEQVETQLLNLQDELDELDRVVVVLRCDVDRWREAFEQARMQHEEVCELYYRPERQRFMEWDAVVRAQLSEFEQNSKDWAATQGDLRSMHERDVANLKDRVLSLQDHVELLSTSEEMLTKQLQHVTDEMASIVDERAELAGHIVRLEGEHLAKEAEWKVERSELRRLQDDAMASWEATLVAERHEKAQIIGDMQRAMDELSKSRLTLSDDVDRVRVEKQEEVNGLKAARDALHARADEMERELAKWMAVMEVLKLEKASAWERVNSLEQNLDESLRHCRHVEEDMERQVKEFAHCQTQLNATVAALTESEQQLMRDIDDLTNAKATADERTNELQSEVGALVEDKRTLQDKLSSLEQQSNQLKSAHAAIEMQLVHSESTCMALQSTISEKEAEVVKQGLVIVDLNARLERLASSEQTLLQDMALLTQEKSDLELQVPETVHKLATLTRSHGELETMVQSKQSEIMRLKDLIDSLTKENAAQVQKVGEVEAVAEQNEAKWIQELAAVTFDRDSSTTKVSVLESAVAKKDGDIAQLELLLQRFKDKVATLTASEAKLKSDVDEAKERLVTMERDHDAAIQILEVNQMELEAQVETKVWEVQGLQDQVAKLTDSCTELTAEKKSIEVDKEALAATQVDLEEQIQKKEFTIRELQTQLVCLSAQHQEIVVAHASLAEDKQGLELNYATKFNEIERALEQSKADLQAAVIDKMDTVTKLQMLLDRFKEKVAQLTASEASVSKELQATFAALAAKTNEGNDLQQKVESLTAQLNKAQLDVEAQRSENAALSQDSIAQSAQIVALTAASVQSQDQVTALTSLVAANTVEMEKLQGLLDRFKEKVAALTTSEAKLTMELTQLRDEKQSLEMTLPEQMEKLTSLSRSHGELELSKRIVDQENDDLKASLAALEQAKAKLTAEREALAAESTHLAGDAAAHAAKCSDLEATLAQKDDEMGKLQDLLNRFKEKVAALTKSQTSLTQQMTTLRDEKLQLELRLPETQEQVASLSRSHSELELSSSTLRADNVRLQATLNSLTQDYDDHMKACTSRELTTTQERQGLVDQIAELEAELNDNHTKRMELQASVSYHEDQVAKLQGLVQRFKEKVSALNKSEDVLTKQVILLTQEKMALEMSVPDHQAKMATLTRAQAELTDTVQALQAQNANLTSELEVFAAEKARLIADHHAKATALDTEKAILEGDLATLAAQLKASAASKTLLGADMLAKEADVVAQAQEIAQLHADIAALQEELKRVTDERDALNCQVPAKEHELASLSRSHSDLESSAQSLRSQNDRLTAELTSLLAELERRTDELHDTKVRCSDLERNVVGAKESESRAVEQLTVARQEWDDQTKTWQAELVSKEEEISHLQELFNEEVGALKADEALATDRYDELVQVHAELSRVHDDVVEKCNLLQVQRDNAVQELTDTDASWKTTCAELSTKVFTLEELLSKKDAAVLDLHASVTTLTAKTADLQQLLDEKIALIAQLERLRATRHAAAASNSSHNDERLSLPDEYALIISENDQLRLGQENLNTIVGVLKAQLAEANEQHDSAPLPWVSSFVQDVAPVLGLPTSSSGLPSLDEVQASLRNVQASIHATVAKKNPRRVTSLDDDVMNVGDLDGSTMSNGSGTWMKAIEESNDLNDKAQHLNQQVRRSRDIGGNEPVAMVSLFPEGVGKDVMSVVLEIVATLNDEDEADHEGESPINIARTLRSAWQYRQRLLRELVAAMHEVHPLPPALPREEQVDVWKMEMRNAVFVTEAQHAALNKAFTTMHHLLYPAQVANSAMDLTKWADYATSAEFADNLRQYTARMEQLERDGDALHDVVVPFLAQFRTSADASTESNHNQAVKIKVGHGVDECPASHHDRQPKELDSSLAEGVHRVHEVLDKLCEALATMHSALASSSSEAFAPNPRASNETSLGSTSALPRTHEEWIQYVRSQPFAELVHGHQALSKQLCKALRLLSDSVMAPATSSPTPATSIQTARVHKTGAVASDSTEGLVTFPSHDDVAGWGEFVASQPFLQWVATRRTSETEAQALCDALQNMHAVLWPRHEMKPSMNATEWTAYIHTQSFVDRLRQCAGQPHEKAICAALHKMHHAIATTAESVGQPLDMSTRSMDLPRWTEYIESDKFDSNLRQYTTRLQDLERESKVLCDELDEMHHVIAREQRVHDDGDGHQPKDMAQWHEYIQTTEFADVMAKYALRQENLEADSHDLHAKVLPVLIKHVPSASTCTTVDELLVAFEANLSSCSMKQDHLQQLAAAVHALNETVNCVRQSCGLAAIETISTGLSLPRHVDALVSALHEVENVLVQSSQADNLSSPPSGLQLTQLVTMMQQQHVMTSAGTDKITPRGATRDDAHVLQLRNILTRLQTYQDKWTERNHRDNENGTSFDDSNDATSSNGSLDRHPIDASDVLKAVELARQCQEAAIHVLETHNRSCVAKTRVEIAMKCSVQRAFLRWKHKVAMASVMTCHAHEVEKLKQVQLYQLIRFRKTALAEKEKAQAETRTATMNEMYAYLQDEAHQVHCKCYWGDKEASDAEWRSHINHRADHATDDDADSIAST
ncbi:hypothetical protein DYB32_004140 [Aphanomyces invadans]|uniref:Uncharacterized protein n=1 Tax=Aphanomyces invadans TaxID=157072 RepID=A0A3R6Z5B5_9STRA|nr:hypothetical protein DYB32_004140 [Aphanomyces invadans]